MATIKVVFGGMEFYAQSWSGPDSRRIVKHPSWGRAGLETEDTGSDGRHERMTATLTDSEYKQLRKLVHASKVYQFTHPRLGSWRARGNIIDRSGFEDDEKIQVELEFIEDKSQPLQNPFDDETPDSKQNQAKAWYEDAEAEMSSTPGDSTTQTLFAEYTSAWDAYEGTVDEYNLGQRDWQDIEGALGARKETGWAVVDNLRGFDTFQEGAYRVEGAIMQTLYFAHEYVVSIQEQGIQWFTHEVLKPQDLYTLCFDVYGHDDHAETIIARNDILDRFYLERGLQLEMPVA